MPYYVTCQLCGANLDPGERCDCSKKPGEPEKQPGKPDKCDLSPIIGAGSVYHGPAPLARRNGRNGRKQGRNEAILEREARD